MAYKHIFCMDKCSVYLDKDANAPIGYFKGYVPFQTFMQMADEIHRIRVENNSNKQLNNCEEMMVLSEDIQKWLNTFWLPRAINTGLRFMAIVLPRDAYGRLSVEKAKANLLSLNGSVQVRYFRKEEEARQWIRSCP
jgi:predicted translin family RNA/ssDNA-binding protein